MQDNSGPAVATTLRAIAAWLESHPEVEAHSIDFPVKGEPHLLAVKSFCHESAFAASLTLQGLGLEPEITAGSEVFRVSALIMPDVRLDLIGPA